MEPVEKDFIQRQVNDQEFFLEGSRFSDNLPALIEDHGPAVEDQLILPSHQVDIGYVGRIVPGPGGKHPEAKIPFPGMKGGRRDVHDQRGPALEALGPGGVSGIPDVLADIHPDDRSPQFKNQKILPPLKIPVFIKHPVVGKVDLMVNPGPSSILKDGRGVVNIILHVGKSDDGGNPPGGPGDFF